jgi:hypothetical protein
MSSCERQEFERQLEKEWTGQIFSEALLDENWTECIENIIRTNFQGLDLFVVTHQENDGIGTSAFRVFKARNYTRRHFGEDAELIWVRPCTDGFEQLFVRGAAVVKSNRGLWLSPMTFAFLAKGIDASMLATDLILTKEKLAEQIRIKLGALFALQVAGFPGHEMALYVLDLLPNRVAL